MPQLRSDAKLRAAPGSRVKAESRASGSASALALTRETGTANLVKSGKKRSTSNTVAEPIAERGRVEGRSRAPPANAVRASTRAFQARLSMRGGRS